jgi:GNAT superfamily N-acetyltransferase
MDLPQIRQRLDEERRYLARDGRATHTLPRLTRIELGQRGLVIWSNLDPSKVDEAILGEIEFHRKAGVPFEWKFYRHDSPPDLLEKLKRHGFSQGPPEAVMVYDLATADLPQEMDGVVRRITTLAQIDHYRLVAEESLNKEFTFTCNELAEAIKNRSTQHLGYIAYDKNDPVSIGRLYTHPLSVFGGLYGGATRPAYRRRGFYRAVVAQRARDARDMGAKYLIVDALPTSRPTLERLGFQRLTETIPCEWQPTLA